MLNLAIIYIIINSASVGFMSEIRKIYQVKSGTGLISTSVFLMVSMLITSMTGVLTEGFSFEPSSLILAFIYAGISSVTAMLCLVGSAWGKLSTIIVCATLGNLALPTLYGLIALPSENSLTVYKIIGFVFAGLTYIMNFCKKDNDTSENKNSFKYNLICVIVFFTQGSALIIFNIVNRLGLGSSEFVTHYTGISAIIMLLIIVGYTSFRLKDSVTQIKRSISVKGLFLMLSYAALTFLSERLSLSCAGMVPLVFQAPVSFCVSIIVISALEFAIYREKLSKTEILQILFAAICNIMFMI